MIRVRFAERTIVMSQYFNAGEVAAYTPEDYAVFILQGKIPHTVMAEPTKREEPMKDAVSVAPTPKALDQPPANKMIQKPEVKK